MMMLYLSIYLLYGVFTLASFWLIAFSYKLLVDSFLNEASFGELRDDYDMYDPMEEDEDEIHDRYDSREFHEYFINLDNSFYALTYVLGFVWLAGFFGVSLTVALYFLSVLALYLYTFINHDFRGFSMASITRLGPFDPRPGYGFDEPAALSPFSDLDSVNLIGSSKSPALSARFGLFAPLETLVAPSRPSVNPAFSTLYRDPFLFSKFTYYYTQFHILSSINEYWSSILSAVEGGGLKVPVDGEGSNFGVRYGEVNSTALFHPLYGSPLAQRRTWANPFRILSQEAFLKRISLVEYRHSYSRVALFDLFEGLAVPVSGSLRVFPSYELEPAGLDFFYSSFSRMVVDLTSQLVSQTSSLLCSGLSKPDSTGLYNLYNISYFRNFPSSYYFRWVSVFFSYRLDYLPFRFKDVLLPDNWRFLSLTKGLPGFSRFSVIRLFSSYSFTRPRDLSRFLKDLLLGVPRFPVSGSSKKYYFMRGYSNFYTGGLLDRFPMLGGIRFFSFMKRRSLAKKYRNDRFRLGNYSSLEKSIADEVSLRKWVGGTGDGLEPFLSPLSNISASFAPDLNSLDSKISDLKSLPLVPSMSQFFKAAAADLPESSFMGKQFTFTALADPRWNLIREIVSHSPSLKVYARNLVYNPASSEFYKRFLSEFGDSPMFAWYRRALFNLAGLLPGELGLGRDLSDHALPLRPPFSAKRRPFIPGMVSLDAKSVLKRIFRVRRRKTFYFAKNRFRKAALQRYSYLRFSRKRVSTLPRKGVLLKARLSPWALLKSTGAGYPALNGRVSRSLLRSLLKDPFAYRRRRARRSRRFTLRKGIRFRRFFWSSTFGNAARSAILRSSSTSSTISAEMLFARYLFQELNGWFLLKFSGRFPAGSSFLMSVLADFGLFGRYFMSRPVASAGALPSWSRLLKAPFSLVCWKVFFEKIFSADSDFLEFLSAQRFSLGMQSVVGRSIINPNASLYFLLSLRNRLILRLPARILRRVSVASSTHWFEMFVRKDWKLLAGTLSSLVFSMVSSLLGNRSAPIAVSSPFFSLLQHYCDSVTDYSYLTRYLFPTLEPRYRDYLYKHHRDPPAIDEYGEDSLLDAEDRLAYHIDWWQTWPFDYGTEAFLKVFLPVLSSAGGGDDGPSSPLAAFGSPFLRFLGGTWDLSDRLSFFIQFPSTSVPATLLFSRSFTRLSALSFSSFELPVLLRHFYREFNYPRMPPKALRTEPPELGSFYGLGLVDYPEDTSFFEDFGYTADFTDTGEDFVDSDFDNEEDLLEIEEEGTEEEEMLDLEREVINPHPNLENFASAILDTAPGALPLVGWSLFPGQKQQEFFHERVGFGSLTGASFEMTDSFVVRRIRGYFFIFAIYCAFKGFLFCLFDKEFIEDYLIGFFYGRGRRFPLV